MCCVRALHIILYTLHVYATAAANHDHDHGRMYLDPTFELNDQWMVTKMIYGAQSDEFDFHFVSVTVHL